MNMMRMVRTSIEKIDGRALAIVAMMTRASGRKRISRTMRARRSSRRISAWVRRAGTSAPPMTTKSKMFQPERKKFQGCLPYDAIRQTSSMTKTM